MKQPEVIERNERVVPEPPPIILKRWAWYNDCQLCGNAYGHPRFPDGLRIVTSRVQSIDEMVGIAKTMNTVYILRDKA